MQNCNFSDRFVSETGLKILILSAGIDADYVDDDEDYGYDPEFEDDDADSSVVKMIMNLYKQDRLNAWGNLQVVFT